VSSTGTPDGDGLPGGPPRDDAGPPRIVALWRRSYGESPLHLLLHLAAIALIAWALSQSFDSRYSEAYKNLAIWMVGGAIINDFVALPLYVGLDKAGRRIWGLVAGDRAPGARAADAPTATAATDADQAAADTIAVGRSTHGDPTAPGASGADQPASTAVTRRTPAVLGNGHVRFPLAMSAVLLLVYFPNITHKAPIGHRLSTGLQEQPDFAGRWLAITAGLLIGSAVLYALRVALARGRARRPA
jgi:hypothetical protein